MRPLTIGSFQASSTSALAPPVGYRYYIFRVQGLRSGTSDAMLSEVNFLVSGVRQVATPVNWNGTFTGNSSSNSSANSFYGWVPANANDGNTTTNWFDNRGSSGTGAGLWFDFGSSVNADSYRWATSTDSGAPNRDPVSWTVYGSNDNVNWTTLSVIANYNTPNVRSTYVNTWPLGATAPAGAPVDTTAFKMWIDFSDSSKVTTASYSSSTRVSAVRDKSFYGNGFARDAGVGLDWAPRYVANVQNGLSAALFFQTGEPPQLLNGPDLWRIAASNAYTMYAVIRQTSGNEAQSSVLSAGNERKFALIADNAALAKGINVSGGVLASVSTSLRSTSAFHIVRLRLSSGTLGIRVDSGSEATTSTGNTDTPSTVVKMGFNGYNFNAGAFRGYVGEILSYNAALSAGEDTAVMSYLTTKWGL